MRVMYIAPRFHTNQLDIIRGWLEHGDQVCFVSHYKGRTEDYTDIKPVVIGYSKLFQLFYFFYVNIIFKNKADAANIKLKCGFPPIGKIGKIIKEFQPDVVIIREKSVYSIFSYLSCRKQKVKSILYNQSPVWEDEIKTDLPHEIVNLFSPKYRMTPVWGKENSKKVRDNNVYYIPFVMRPRFEPEEKYANNGDKNSIEIFEVGKYEERKNHKMMVEIINELKDKFPVHLSIAGECSTVFHQKYFKELEQMIKKYHLEERITLHKNLDTKEMEKEYKKADVFVIPSTKEPASISQLEAMAFSLPVICGDKNGTACYVEHGINGYLFQDNDYESLKNTIEKMISNRNKMIQMGTESYGLILEKYQFKKYYKKIMEILKEYGKSN